ncbi:cytoplasmic phosphatidylinositol transfer protein 1-like [Portunus trituberculatus]|uniref:cytoplasmic phosphatidylinositol transfer protein 1-like n=1 Tax=Portunus trituberculatus TaxID=210409 RepID=UPI001E1CB641|nr:cytoplasmic phosphatidylinositol transfer protein 1-like [Portunus trituberculatus]
MLKEYRICMPMSVEEYHIGQLYMIARHSLEQSQGGEGVEVVENTSHTDPVHGQGQYTEKRIHLSGKLPVWIRSYIPRFIYLTERAWNYYPYTETELTCSVVPRFSIKIRTRYENNNGSSENCLNVEEEELKKRTVDRVDILTDPVDEKHYKEEEDPSVFRSEKTGRGPLEKGWDKCCDVIMCSYKLVDVSFQVFGLQTKVEEFVHRAIRNILLLGHRQAFTWIDEWYGMTIDDVREYESGMQEKTNEKVRKAQKDIDGIKAPETPEGEEEEGEKEAQDLKASGKLSKSDSLSSQGSESSQSQRSGYLSSWFKWS